MFNNGFFFVFQPKFNMIRIFDKKRAKNVIFLKKSKFWLFFLSNSKNLRLGEKTKKKTFL